jgi:hypothetical protein
MEADGTFAPGDTAEELVSKGTGILVQWEDVQFMELVALDSESGEEEADG